MKIVVIGDLLYDHFIWAEHLPRLGETVTGYKTGFYAGGKGGNQAVQIARLGAEVHMIGKVGKDERGRFLIESLQKEGVHTEFVFEDPTVDTGTDCVSIDRKGDNAIIVAPLANEKITVEEVQQAKELIESCNVLLSQLQINEEAITEAFRIAKEAHVPIVLNPAPARDIPEKYWQMADFITPNETEAEFYTGCYQENMQLEEWKAKVAEAFAKRGVQNLIVTLGEHGAMHCQSGVRTEVPAFKVNAVDTTAAGDSFNAAFCVSLAGGNEIKDAIRYGNAAGGLTAAEYGSFPSMPTKEKLEQFIKDK